MIGVVKMVEMNVLVTVACERVILVAGTPAQEQADLYLTVPLQADAYVGTRLDEMTAGALQVGALTCFLTIFPSVGTVGSG